MIEWSLVPLSFLMVFLKAFQQKNVMLNKYWAVPLVTYGQAFCEVFVITGVVFAGRSWAAVNGVALGGMVGCLLAIFIHNRIFRKREVAP